MVMKMRIVLRSTVLSLAVVLGGSITLYAQGGPPDGGQPNRRPQGDVRANLFRELGLSRDQMQQIRRYNVERRPQMEAAQRQFRDANRRLDEAIYADQLNEAEVEERIKAVQRAQSELISLRSSNELSLRKILTPGQLTRFRRLRQRFNESGPGRDRQAFVGPERIQGDR